MITCFEFEPVPPNRRSRLLRGSRQAYLLVDHTNATRDADMVPDDLKNVYQ